MLRWRLALGCALPVQCFWGPASLCAGVTRAWGDPGVRNGLLCDGLEGWGSGGGVTCRPQLFCPSSPRFLAVPIGHCHLYTFPREPDHPVHVREAANTWDVSDPCARLLGWAQGDAPSSVEKFGGVCTSVALRFSEGLLAQKRLRIASRCEPRGLCGLWPQGFVGRRGGQGGSLE